jgi:tetratricopeptide (TPR) repeat protein
VVEDVRATARGERAGEALRLLENAVDALGRDRPAEAIRAATEAKGVAPRSSAVRETLGLALYRGERYREALRELQAYRRITGRSDQNHVVADCHRALGVPQKALPLVREALAAPIGAEVKAEAAVVGGAALADMGRFEEALTMLRRFPTSSAVARPHDLRVWYVTADVLERAGRPRDAAREFRKILRHDPEAFDVAERLAALS